MSEAITSNDVVPITPLSEWQGPAVNHPALAGDDQTLEGFLADPAALSSAAIWVSVTSGPAILGKSSPEPIDPKIMAFLIAWHRRHGQAKLDELKRQVLDTLKRGKALREITPEELCRRIDVLFDQVST